MNSRKLSLQLFVTEASNVLEYIWNLVDWAQACFGLALIISHMKISRRPIQSKARRYPWGSEESKGQ
jgi:hypothetical protein